MGILHDNCQRCGHLLPKYSITYCDRCLFEIDKERIEINNKREEVYERMRKNGMSVDDIEEVDNLISGFFLYYFVYPIIFTVFFPSEIEKFNDGINKYVFGLCTWIVIEVILSIVLRFIMRIDNKIIINGSSELDRKYLEMNKKIMNPILLIMILKAIFTLFT